MSGWQVKCKILCPYRPFTCLKIFECKYSVFAKLYSSTLANNSILAVIQYIFFTKFLAATKQLYKWYFPSVRLSVRPSVRPSVRLSVCHTFLAATKQLYKWYFPSVCPSVCLSVCHTFFTMFPSSYHPEIFRSYYHGQKWCPCKGSRSEVKGQGHRGQHPT